MLRDTFQNTYLVVLSLSTVSAGFSDFFFAGNGGNSSAKKLCVGTDLDCPPPSLCAHDDKLDKYYCCIPGSQGAVCWSLSDGCNGANDTTPGSNQKLCGDGQDSFCCWNTSETCTERTNQVNVCWSTTPNPIAALNATAVNDTALSLSSAQPSATSYSVQLSALATLTSTTPGQPSATSTSSSTGTPSTQPSSPVPSADSSSGISGGAIGGIVGGVVGGLALLGLAGFFLWRRRKNNKHNPYEAANSHEPSHTDESPSAVEMSTATAYAEAPATEKYRSDANPLAEAPSERPVAELP